MYPSLGTPDLVHRRKLSGIFIVISLSRIELHVFNGSHGFASGCTNQGFGAGHFAWSQSSN